MMIDGINQLPAQTYFYPFFFTTRTSLIEMGLELGGPPFRLSWFIFVQYLGFSSWGLETNL